MTQSCPAIGIGTIRPILAERIGPIMRICYWPEKVLATPHVSPVAMAESRVALRGPVLFLMVRPEGFEPRRLEWKRLGAQRGRIVGSGPALFLFI